MSCSLGIRGADCDGNYPVIASAFTRVPNNFDSVNNNIDKFTLYKTLSVAENAVEHVQCASNKCAETGKSDVFAFNYEDVDDLDMGFLQFPLRIRTDFVQVCGKVKCAEAGPVRTSDVECCTADDIDCGDAVLGFVHWPKHQVAQDVRACNAIRQDIGCRRNRRGPEAPRKCRTIVDCDSSLSSISASQAVPAPAVAKAVHAKSHSHHKKRGGCGCH